MKQTKKNSTTTNVKKHKQYKSMHKQIKRDPIHLFYD